MASDPSLSAAQVRFVEVSPGSPEMDFYVNGTGAAYGVGYESFTSYVPVSSGQVSLSANRSGLGQALVSAQSTLSGGHQYTAVVSHGVGSLQEHVYADQDTAAPAGSMALRVLNELEGAATLTVYIMAAQGGTAPVVLTAGAGTASGYVHVAAAGSYVVTATVNEKGLNLPVGSVTVKASSGAVRTVVFGGTTQNAGHSAVVGFTLEDADPT